jgi:hypothetical protein
MDPTWAAVMRRVLRDQGGMAPPTRPPGPRPGPARHLPPPRCAAPPPRGPSPEQRAALARLGLAWPCTAEEARAAYRRRSLQLHPDVGGSGAAFARLGADYRLVQSLVGPARAASPVGC